MATTKQIVNAAMRPLGIDIEWEEREEMPTPMTIEMEAEDALCKLGDSSDLCDIDRNYLEMVIREALQSPRAQPKYKRVDLDVCFKDLKPLFGSRYDVGYGYNIAIDYIKSKYGELYAEVKE